MVSSLLFSCKKRDGDNDVDDPTPGTIDTYLPTTAGSWWLYENESSYEQYKREATGIDSLKAGLVFKYFTFTPMATMDANPEFYGKFDGTDYYTLFDFTGDGSQYFKAIVMKDDPYVGMSWLNTDEIPYSLGSVKVEVNCEIQSTTEVITTGGTTFNNVIKMKGKMRARVSAIPWTDCGDVTFWFAPEVGIVKQDYNIRIRLMSVTLYENIHVDNLKSYYIAP